MPDPTPTSRHRAHQPSTGGGNAVYTLGLIGALVYFYRQADSVPGYVLGTLKAIVWPAFLVHEAFRRLNSRPNPYDDGTSLIDNP